MRVMSIPTFGCITPGKLSVRLALLPGSVESPDWPRPRAGRAEPRERSSAQSSRSRRANKPGGDAARLAVLFATSQKEQPMSEPSFNANDAHEFFSKSCFNRAWDLIDQSDRTPEDNEQMLLLSQAALWHWTQRPDCTPKNLSIGYWQLSRIHAIQRDADAARKAGQNCLEKSPTDDPFLMGYAHEALCRAELVAGHPGHAKDHHVKAVRFAEQITDKEDQEILLKDLKELESRL
jgi:hypothetical protein